MDELKLELWNNVVETPCKRRRSVTKPFVFTMGFLAGVAVSALVGHALFG